MVSPELDDSNRSLSCSLLAAIRHPIPRRCIDGSTVDDTFRHAYLEPIVGKERTHQLPIFLAMVMAYGFVASRVAITAIHNTTTRVASIVVVGMVVVIVCQHILQA